MRISSLPVFNVLASLVQFNKHFLKHLKYLESKKTWPLTSKT